MASEPLSEYSSLEKVALKGKNPNSHSCYCVAFRLDDIMDYFVTNPLIQVMKIFDEKNVNLTIGIIGDSFGNDKRLVSYIKERTMSNISSNNAGAAIEIANHGWKHENFSNLSPDEMSKSMRKTNEKIKNIFGITPTVFIAPYNDFNDDIFSALHKNNLPYFSASEKYDPPPYSITSDTTIYHLPQTAYTGDCNICAKGVTNASGITNASWHAVPHEKTLNQINRSLHKYGFAVVTLHAWEYSKGHDKWNFTNEIDLKQIRELRLLLDKIQQEGLRVVTLGNIINQFNISTNLK